MTDFKKKVYQEVRKITKGEIRTYKEIAKATGRPKAWRAVGNILAKNFNPAIPCHRIVRSDGKIGGYNRGILKKKLLLKNEKSI